MPRRGAVTKEKYRVTQDSRSTLPSNVGPFTPARCPRRISIGERRTETKLTEFMRRRCYKEIFQRNLRRIGAIMKFLGNFSELIIMLEQNFRRTLNPAYIFNSNFSSNKALLFLVQYAYSPRSLILIKDIFEFLL